MSMPPDRPTPLSRPALRGGGTRGPGSGLAPGRPVRPAVRGCGHDGADTPDAATQAAALVEEILALHDALAVARTLDPAPRTNALFGRLVALAVAPRDPRVVDRVLADTVLAARLPHLRAVCARGEYALEHAWARHVVAAADPLAALEAFPYLQNYRDLTRIEYHAVAGHAAAPPRRALFVGSGPLPLSALLLARHGVAVDALDLDDDAVRLGRRLARVLSDDVSFAQGDVLACGDLSGYDLVCVAALVGLDPAEKSGALARLRARMRPGATVLARSAHGLRGLLYPVLDVADAAGLGGLEPVAVLHPHTDVVNSVVLARVPG